MPNQILQCIYSPMIECPEKMELYKEYNNTVLTLFQTDDGKYFFYCECDPGLFYPYLWWKCSPGRIEWDPNRMDLHFYTRSGSHYIFRISGLSYNKLNDYIVSVAQLDESVSLRN